MKGSEMSVRCIRTLGVRVLRSAGRWLGAVFFCGLFFPLRAATAASADGSQTVIAPGKEQLLGEMVGLGAALPGGCSLEDGKVEHKTIRAAYKCETGTVVYQLSHPDEAPAGAVKTKRFALALVSGTPPAGFQDTLKELIVSKEPAFEWTVIIPPKRPEMERSSHPIALLAAAVAAAGAAAWFLLRRGASRPGA